MFFAWNMTEHSHEGPHPSERICLRCGNCCGPYFALYVEEVDEKRWQEEGRQDLLDRLEYERQRAGWDKDGPFNMETMERMEKCVFLVRNEEGELVCGIHETKPLICRDYPPGSSEICVLSRKAKS